MSKCRFCVSNKLPGAADASGPQAPFGEPGLGHLALASTLLDGGDKAMPGGGIDCFGKKREILEVKLALKFF